ncbi:unnamed protein product, partial [marine sediment metagenome]
MQDLIGIPETTSSMSRADILTPVAAVASFTG